MFQLSSWINVRSFFFFPFFRQKVQLILIIKQCCRNVSLQCESINYYVTSCADFRPLNHTERCQEYKGSTPFTKPSVGWSEALLTRNGLEKIKNNSTMVCEQTLMCANLPCGWCHCLSPSRGWKQHTQLSLLGQSSSGLKTMGTPELRNHGNSRAQKSWEFQSSEIMSAPKLRIHGNSRAQKS